MRPMNLVHLALLSCSKSFGRGVLSKSCNIYNRVLIVGNHCLNDLSPKYLSASVGGGSHQCGILSLFRGQSLRECSVQLIPKRYFHSTNPTFKGQYEYDPNTNSFRPKDHHDNPVTAPKQEKSGGKWKSFTWRYLKTLFMLTGGITWCGIIFVAFFVDRIEVEDDEVLLNNGEEAKLRTLAFYDILKAKKDLMSMIVKGKHEDIESEMSKKEKVFIEVWEKVRNEESVLESLGKPVQLCGYQAAGKVNQILESFGEMAEKYQNKGTDDSKEWLVDVKNTWEPECIIEGSLHTGLLSLVFERADPESDWVLVSVKLQTLAKTEHFLCNLSGSLPNGLKHFTKFSN